MEGRGAINRNADTLISKRTSVSGRTILTMAVVVIFTKIFDWNLGAIWGIAEKGNVKPEHLAVVSIVVLMFLSCVHFSNWMMDWYKESETTLELLAGSIERYKREKEEHEHNPEGIEYSATVMGLRYARGTRLSIVFHAIILHLFIPLGTAAGAIGCLSYGWIISLFAKA